MSAGEQLIETREQVVARDDANTDLVESTVLARNVAHGTGARGWVHAARVRDDAHAPVSERGEHALDRADEVARVPHVRVALLLLLQDGHRDSGEIVEHQVVDGSTLYLTSRCLEPITPEALSGRHTDDAIVRAAHVGSR